MRRFFPEGSPELATNLRVVKEILFAVRTFQRSSNTHVLGYSDVKSTGTTGTSSRRMRVSDLPPIKLAIATPKFFKETLNFSSGR